MITPGVAPVAMVTLKNTVLSPITLYIVQPYLCEGEGRREERERKMREGEEDERGGGRWERSGGVTEREEDGRKEKEEGRGRQI